MSGNQELITNEISGEQSIDELTGNTLSESLVGSGPIILANTASDPNLSIQDNLTGISGGTLTVPISINDATGVQSLTLTLNYDTNIFDVIDPVEDTETNEAIRRTGISEDWTLTAGEGDNPDAELPNPVAKVDDENGEIEISLFNPNGVTPEGSGNIVEIDFSISADAATDSTTTIDLRSARLGIDGKTDETVLGDSLLGDGTVTVGVGGSLDVDGNGATDALTDGVLIVRHLFGFSGDSLIDGAIGTNATKTTADEIASAINDLIS